MELQKFIQKKYIRFLNSSKVLKFFFYYHKLFNNKGMKDIGFDFRKKKNRLFIVQYIIQKKNYKSYLEIGCFDDELFNHIKCCLLYTSPSPRDRTRSRMPSSA